MPYFSPSTTLRSILSVVNTVAPMSYYDIQCASGIDGVKVMRIAEQSPAKALFRRKRVNLITRFTLSPLGEMVKESIFPNEQIREADF